MRIWCIALLLTLLASCGQSNEIESPADAVAASTLEERLSSIETRVSALETSAPQTTAFLPITGDSGYSVINTTHGPLLVAIEGAQPQGNGQAITLRVGNLTSARYHGMTFTVLWGPNFSTPRAADAPELSPIEQRRHSITISDDIMPGAWTTVRFSMGPVRVEDFGMILISEVRVDNLSLRN